MGKKIFYKISFCISIYCYYGDFLKIYISQGSVATHLRCGVYVVTSLLQIFHRMCRLKNFENRSILGEDMEKVCGLVFVWPTLYTTMEWIVSVILLHSSWGGRFDA